MNIKHSTKFDMGEEVWFVDQEYNGKINELAGAQHKAEVGEIVAVFFKFWQSEEGVGVYYAVKQKDREGSGSVTQTMEESEIYSDRSIALGKAMEKQDEYIEREKERAKEHIEASLKNIKKNLKLLNRN